MNRWAEVVEEHGPAVYGTAWRLLGVAAETEAVVEATFAAAYRQCENKEVRDADWPLVLRRLVLGLSLERLRRRALESRRSRPFRSQSRAAQLQAAIGRLPELDASAFALHFLEELPTEEVAETLHLSYAATEAALDRACARLAELMHHPTGAPGAA